MTKTKYERKAKLIQPLLNAKFGVGDSIAVTCLGAIYEGKPQKGAKEGDKPADLMPCVNLDTGEQGEIIVPAVVKSVIEESFPDASYVGKSFYIEKGNKPEGKRYFQYIVDELEVK